MFSPILLIAEESGLFIVKLPVRGIETYIELTERLLKEHQECESFVDEFLNEDD